MHSCRVQLSVVVSVSHAYTYMCMTAVVNTTHLIIIISLYMRANDNHNINTVQYVSSKQLWHSQV